MNAALSKTNPIRLSWNLGLVIVMLAAGFGLRLVGLTNPPFDFHPTRQLQDALIARGFYYQMLPQPDPLKAKTALDNLKSRFEFEPRILERIVAVTYLVTGGENVWVARIYSSLFWLIGGLALFNLARRISSSTGGLLALAFYLFLPFAVSASRSFQPDPFMVMWILLALWSLQRWSEGRTWKMTLLTGLFSGIAVLIKIYAAVFLGPVLIAVTLNSVGLRGAIKNKQAWVMAAFSIIIPSAYYLARIPGNSLSFFSLFSLSFTNLLIKPKFYFSWLNMINQIAGKGILLAGLIGLLLLPSKGRVLVAGLWVGYGLFGLLEPYQITTHDYYSLPVVPILALSLSGLITLVHEKITWQQPFWRTAAAGIVVLTLLISGWIARNALISPNYSSEAGGWAQLGAEMPRDGKIIALTHDYGFRIAYYGWINVDTWPTAADFALTGLMNSNQSTRQPSQSEFDQYFETLTAGHKYFLVTLFNELDSQTMLKTKLYNSYPTFQKGDGYIIFDLDHPSINSQQP
jgi:4-amino-4-deoxy-L-arabinose transferase-like glycosyltransferase